MREGWEGSIGSVISEEDYYDLMWMSGVNQEDCNESYVNSGPIRFEEEDAKMRESDHG